MVDLVVLMVVLLIIGSAVAYIVKEKKRGVRCVGCSMSGQCAGKCSSMAGSSDTEHTEIQK